MQQYIPAFMDKGISGDKLLALDTNQLKRLGVEVKQDRERIRDNANKLKKVGDKERKRVEKERKLSGGGEGSGGGSKKGGKGLVSSILR